MNDSRGEIGHEDEFNRRNLTGKEGNEWELETSLREL